MQVIVGQNHGLICLFVYTVLRTFHLKYRFTDVFSGMFCDTFCTEFAPAIFDSNQIMTEFVVLVKWLITNFAIKTVFKLLLFLLFFIISFLSFFYDLINAVLFFLNIFFDFLMLLFLFIQLSSFVFKLSLFLQFFV